jgi:hypothetical protein
MYFLVFLIMPDVWRKWAQFSKAEKKFVDPGVNVLMIIYAIFANSRQKK